MSHKQPNNKQNKREHAERVGRMAERLALWLLRLKGYKIRECRYRCPVGEIDLIAEKGTHLMAVEVKYRKDMDTAIHAVTTKQQQRIARAALWYSTNNPKIQARSWRFDVIALAPARFPRHIKDAWRTHSPF